jgi:hypothetical protein
MNYNEIIRKISELKTNLVSTDYQVIKCYEASLLQETMPYDLDDILNQRKVWRNEINDLESQLLNLTPEKVLGPSLIESND